MTEPSAEDYKSLQEQYPAGMLNAALRIAERVMTEGVIAKEVARIHSCPNNGCETCKANEVAIRRALCATDDGRVE